VRAAARTPLYRAPRDALVPRSTPHRRGASASSNSPGNHSKWEVGRRCPPGDLYLGRSAPYPAPAERRADAEPGRLRRTGGLDQARRNEHSHVVLPFALRLLSDDFIGLGPRSTMARSHQKDARGRSLPDVPRARGPSFVRALKAVALVGGARCGIRRRRSWSAGFGRDHHRGSPIGVRRKSDENPGIAHQRSARSEMVCRRPDGRGGLGYSLCPGLSVSQG